MGNLKYHRTILVELYSIRYLRLYSLPKLIQEVKNLKN